MKRTNRPDRLEDNPETSATFGHVSSSRYVDQTLLRNLKSLDPLLEPRWNPLKGRWEIFRDDLYVMTVQTVAGDYAPLDNRVLQRLFIIDTARYKDKFDYIRHLHLDDEHLMKMKQKEQDEYVRACHRDMQPMLINRKSFTADTKKVAEQDGLRRSTTSS